MGKFLAYLLVALFGFLIGSVMYYVAIFTIGALKEFAPVIWEAIVTGKEYIGMIASGIIGSVISVVSAYLWARSTA